MSQQRFPSGVFVLVGRSSACDFRTDAAIIQTSRKHLMVILTDKAISIRDLGSENGTRINDELISGTVKLQEGDKLKIGPIELLFSLEEDGTVLVLDVN